jgi:hypothetical protein
VVLLGRRRNVTIAEGHWQSAAGQLLKSEPIKRGMACETWEELGITNPEEDLDLVRALRQLDADDGRERIQQDLARNPGRSRPGGIASLGCSDPRGRTGLR